MHLWYSEHNIWCRVLRDEWHRYGSPLMGLARYIQSSCMEMNCLVECKYKTEFAYCSKRGRYTYMMKLPKSFLEWHVTEIISDQYSENSEEGKKSYLRKLLIIDDFLGAGCWRIEKCTCSDGNRATEETSRHLKSFLGDNWAWQRLQHVCQHASFLQNWQVMWHLKAPIPGYW